jgi:hypothetical protein
VSLMVSGCASTVQLNSIDEAKIRIGKGSATVILRSGQEYEGWDVQVGSDSVRFIDMKTAGMLQFSNKEVKSIEITKHKIGYSGPLIGGIALGTLAFIVFSSNHKDEEYTNRNVRDAFTAIGVGVGGAVGLAIEVLNGHHYTYIFPKDSIKVEEGTSIDSTNNSNLQILKSAP